MKQLKLLSFYIILSSALSFCTPSDVHRSIEEFAQLSKPVTKEEVGRGLKEALIVGISNGANLASSQDGFFKNPLIRIPFPQDVQRVENTLRKVGLGNEVDNFILTLNRAAENAAKEAAPIFISSIKQMTIADAWGILKGEKDQATQYLRKTTSDQLMASFRPVIKDALEKVYATKYYADIINSYNRIPGVQKASPDLEEYATQKAIDGLFLLVAQEEVKIRENPAARTTELLKRVFSEQNQK